MGHKKFSLLIIAYSIITGLYAQQHEIDLSGFWQVSLNRDNTEMHDVPASAKMKGMIQLPSSLAQQGFGLKTTGSDFGFLTPEYRYLGVANYEREITIPEEWEGKQMEIFLERVLWESRVFIDGNELSVKDALGTPHIHEIGTLESGRHELLIKVNNEMIHNIGDKGHAYGSYTQGIWNGIVGKMELRAYDPTHINSIKTYPLIDSDQLKVVLDMQAIEEENAKIEIEIRELNKDDIVSQNAFPFLLNQGKNQKDILIDLKGQLKKWNEFEPTVYVLKAKLKTSTYRDTRETEFGNVDISHDGTHILINKKPVFLRGNLDCVHFPLTGYPSTKVEDWVKIFKTYKEYGLNHARFHSWCPPEAAFKAANRVGIYLQAEASMWIDWWMSEDMIAKGRPEMDTKGHPKGLGYDRERDQFVVGEMNRVVDFYGNHPSFTMFCIGNELGNADFEVLEKWIFDLKKKDPRHLYAASTARTITDVDDYMATHYIQDIGRTRGLNGASTNWDFEKVYSQLDLPIIAHEIGQWPVYPTWDEIDKYTGVLKARNLQEFKETAIKNGIVDQDEKFKMASGALNQIMYKYETESFLRTRSCAGVQLLSMQDYQGQGEALIGWLDAFWDSKGITTPEKFREHFSEIVPLLRMEKFVWTTDEVFDSKIQLFHYGQFPIDAGEIVATITAESGEIIKEQSWPVKDLARGSLIDIGNLKLALQKIVTAQKLHISIALKNTIYKNEWNIWVFPDNLPVIEVNEVIVSEQIDSETIFALENGKKVLLLANELGEDENSVLIDFYPLYWSLTFFPGQGKTSIGMLLQEDHPAFKHFPTSYHSDWQWEPFENTTRAFILNDMPHHYKPIAQVVDDFHRNNKEGAIFEFKVGNGKLLVCGFDVNSIDSPVARQLKYSLLKYMESNEFKPESSVDTSFLKELFPLIPQAEETKVKGDFPLAILHIKASENLIKLDTVVPWAETWDKILIQKEGVNYSVKEGEAWRDKKRSAWQGKKIKLEVECPSGILGTLYVQLDDWNDNGREGIVEFEGRKMLWGSHTGKEDQWLKFHVMREDSNDGKLILDIKAQKGKKLMIREIVLEKG